MRPDWYARVRATFPHLSPDVADEVAQHLADLHEEALAGGASETEAAAVVRAALRDAAPLLDDPRSAPPAGASLWQSGQRRDERGRAGGAMFVHLGRDLTYALRTLRRQPTFAAVTIVTLAVGLGVNVAVFAVLRAALLASLSVPHPGQLVSIVTWTGAGGDHTDFSYPLYVDARDGAAPIADVAAYTAGTAGIAAADHRERVSVEFTTANYFTVLGVPMRLGPGFTGADERRGAPAVAIIGDGVWRSMFNADANVVGRTLLVNGDQATIVGVAPPSFTGFVRGRRADIWLTVSQYFPLSRSEDRMERRTTSWLSLFARLHDGIPREQLQERLTALLGSAREPGEGSDWSVHANAAAAGDASLVSDLAHPLRLLMIVVGLILVITAANVANLLLARSYSRQWEMAIRQSLGASHGRIVQQLIVEAGVLAAAGAVCALVAGTWVARLFELRTIGGGALSLSVRPDVAVVGFTAAIAIAAALTIGIVPAIGIRRLVSGDTIKNVGDSTRIARGRGRLGAALTVVQIALSLVLVVGAGLFLRSLAKIRAVDPSMASDRRIAATLNTTLRGYDEARGRQFYEQVLDAAARQPGIQSAALAYVLPATAGGMRNNLPPRSTMPSIEEAVEYDLVPVSPGFFQTTDLPLLAGRDFRRSDSSTSPPVIVINERMRSRFWPSGDALGQIFKAGTDSYTVVGVARETKYRSLRENPRMVMYLPLAQLHVDAVNLVVKTALPADATTAALREAVRSVDPAMPLYNVRTFAEHVDQALYLDRVRARLISWLAALALALAAVGIYGVVSYTVTQRTREVGIRLALGAQRSEILALLLGSGARLALTGIVAGGALAAWLTRGIASQLYGITAHDPVTLAAAAAILFGVALAATYIPARRATRIDPMTAVKFE